MTGRTHTARARDRIIGGAAATGWRAACLDGTERGAPHLMLVHPDAHVLWWVLLRHDAEPDQLDSYEEAWRTDLARAGAAHHVVRAPSEVDAFLRDLRDVAETKAAP